MKNASFFKDDFRSFAANNGVLRLILGFKSLKVRNSVTKLLLHCDRLSHKLGNKRRKMQVFLKTISDLSAVNYGLLLPILCL